MLLLAWDDLPQIAQNSQKLLLGMTSHRLQRFAQMVRVRRFSHRLHRCNFRGCTCLRSALPLARARSAPTKQTVILPQISQNSQNLLLGMTSHRLHRFTQMVRLRKIVAEVSLPPQQQSAYHRFHRSTQKLLISGWCTSCSVGALLALASGKAERRQVHPLEGTLTICADL